MREPRIWDITPSVSPRLSVWPGDVALSRQVQLQIERGDSVTLSALTATVHLGAHADAPSHYGAGAATIEQRPLDLYIGRCQLLDLPTPRGTRLPADALPAKIEAPRVLIRTGSFPNPESWNEDFAALSVEAIERLHRHGVRLIGIDTPSVDLQDSKDLPAHQAFLRNDMAILEGLALGGVPAGIYELIALPLKLEQFDASPVRAILRELL